MNEEIIQNTEAFVRSRLAGESTGHDWHHANRVRKTALTIQKTEGGDALVLELTMLLHDVGDRKVLKTHDDDPDIAAEFLRSQPLESSVGAKVIHIISNMSYSKSLDQKEIDRPIELLIAQDADRLDAIGAIGIARAFAFGGSRDRLLYDPDYTARTFASSDAYKNAGGSTLHHFEEKLFKLKEGLNTETAQQIAARRDAFMHDFHARFLEEWNGRA